MIKIFYENSKESRVGDDYCYPIGARLWHAPKDPIRTYYPYHPVIESIDDGLQNTILSKPWNTKIYKTAHK